MNLLILLSACSSPDSDSAFEEVPEEVQYTHTIQGFSCLLYVNTDMGLPAFIGGNIPVDQEILPAYPTELVSGGYFTVDAEVTYYGNEQESVFLYGLPAEVWLQEVHGAAYYGSFLHSPTPDALSEVVLMRGCQGHLYLPIET